VQHNQESTRLQYALTDRARQLGWAREQVVVIDDDLGRSAASTLDRPGFQRLVAEVGLGHVGLVLGIEVSRLPRSCRDWHHLLEMCALFDTLPNGPCKRQPNGSASTRPQSTAGCAADAYMPGWQSVASSASGSCR
jgi:hypothetical protein